MKKKKYTFTAVVQQRSDEQAKYGFIRILLREVRVGKLLFRDHLWVPENKRLIKIPNGTVIQFSATIEDYINIDDFSKPKQKLRDFKSIKIIHKFKGKIHLNLDQFKENKYV